MLQTVQRHGVYSAAYGTVHYKEPLKSFKIRVGHMSVMVVVVMVGNGCSNSIKGSKYI